MVRELGWSVSGDKLSSVPQMLTNHLFSALRTQRKDLTVSGGDRHRERILVQCGQCISSDGGLRTDAQLRVGTLETFLEGMAPELNLKMRRNPPGSEGEERAVQSEGIALQRSGSGKQVLKTNSTPAHFICLSLKYYHLVRYQNPNVSVVFQ